jgi:hypothetical protein
MCSFYQILTIIIVFSLNTLSRPAQIRTLEFTILRFNSFSVVRYIFCYSVTLHRYVIIIKFTKLHFADGKPATSSLLTVRSNNGADHQLTGIMLAAPA